MNTLREITGEIETSVRIGKEMEAWIVGEMIEQGRRKSIRTTDRIHTTSQRRMLRTMTEEGMGRA